MRKTCFLSLLCLVLLNGPGFACTGQTGKVVFEDSFPDDSGGWQITPPSTQVTPPNLVFTPTQNTSVVSLPNLTFSATDGDYCTEFYLPKTTADGAKAAVGLTFWGTDASNTYMMLLTSLPEVDFYKKTGGNWSLISSATTLPSFVSDPAATNAIRVVAKNGKLTLFLNNTQIKAVRAQVPQGALQFGLFIELTQWSSAALPIRVKSFKITDDQ